MKKNIFKEKYTTAMGCVLIGGLIGYVMYSAYKGAPIDNTVLITLGSIALLLLGIKDSLLGIKKDQ